MGRITGRVEFDGPAPSIHRIAEKLAELVRLSVRIENLSDEVQTVWQPPSRIESGQAQNAEPNNEIENTYRVQSGNLSFARVPSLSLKIEILPRYQVGRRPSVEEVVRWYGYLGQEPTLMFATELALISLGGRSEFPVDDELRSQYGQPIEAEQLLERHAKHGREQTIGCLFAALLSPLLWPFICIWHLLTFPLWLWRFRKKKSNSTPIL